jgi:hypothetical protein
LKTINERENMKVVKTYSSEECSSFDVYNENNLLVAYYNEFYKNPEDNTLLENTVYEIYYDFEDENDSTTSTSSYLFDDFENFSTTLIEIVEDSLNA